MFPYSVLSVFGFLVVVAAVFSSVRPTRAPRDADVGATSSHSPRCEWLN
ncbi:MAG: hypothetical protein U0935_24780 [Pirellulales bacterium]